MYRFGTIVTRAAVLVIAGTAAALLSFVPSLQWLSLVLTVTALAALGWSIFRQASELAVQRSGADALRRRNIELEGRAEAGAADAIVSGERLRSIIDSAVDGIVVIDQAGTIESFNPAAERLFGYPAAEAVGQNIRILMPSPYREEHDGYLRRYLTTGEARIIGIGREVTGCRRDGTVFPVHISVGQMTIRGQRKFTGILHDLTGRVRLEEQLREGAALAKVGEMAAVIAHEVKNPLAGIRGAIQVIGSRLAPGTRDAAVVGDIIKRIDALDGLINDLLLFARPPQPRLGAVEVAPLLTMTADLLCRDPSLEGITVDVEGSAPPLLADAEMLKIVFQNLLVNSAHAMHGRGTIAVEIGTNDDACQVSITDRGPGIPPEIRNRVFTAFFTTKSRGSGLGLATAKRMIEAHRGDIRIECPPGGGTRVIVTIPNRAPGAAR